MGSETTADPKAAAPVPHGRQTTRRARRAATVPGAFARRIGVRTWSVLVAVVVVFGALLLGVSGLLFLLSSDLVQTADAKARARASEVVAQISTQGLSATERTIRNRPQAASVVQIVTADGRVLSASTPEVRHTPMSAARPDLGEYASTEVDLGLRPDDEYMVATTTVRVGDDLYYIKASVPISEQRNTIRTVAIFLLAGTPILLGSVAIAVWVLVGRALGSVERIRATVANIDANRLAERVDVPPTRDEIAALAATMNSMLDRLQAADRAQRGFVSDASHELRSPLATLTTAGELAETAPAEQRAALVATMNVEISRLSGLVDNLMTLARADAHDLPTRRTEVDLDDLVAAEAGRIRLTGDIKVSAQIEPVRVLADQQQLAQALRNLVDNARHHAHSAIRLTLTRTESEAIIWVDNDGPTIPAADRQRIFERFVRLDEARDRDAGGSGLGLAITRAALRAHGGEASVVDAPDGWCRFELRMPQ